MSTTTKMIHTGASGSRNRMPKRKDVRKFSRKWDGKKSGFKLQREQKIRHLRDEKYNSRDCNRLPEQTYNNEEWRWSRQDKAPEQQQQYPGDFKIHYHHEFNHYHTHPHIYCIKYTSTTTTTIPPLDLKCSCTQPNPNTHYHHYYHHHHYK